jgi:glucose-6-phosphate 1-dehydrogenase
MKEQNPLRVGLDDERIAPPCAVVIFGASGDLTRRKLVPALYNLAASRLLDPGTAVVGFARQPMSDDEFRTAQRAGIEKHSRRAIDDAVWADFGPGLAYVAGNYDDPAAYRRLAARLERLDLLRGTRQNRLYYLATPPDTFAVVVRQLAHAGLLYPPESGAHFSRVVIEKPFGRDLASSRALDAELHEVADERQIFRIDHYLGKEAVQNIMAFRFANSIFEPLWHREHVDHVQITAAEDIGIEGRGRFYERAGTTRDIIQNHLLQLVMVAAMEPPTTFEADAVRDEKVKVLKALRPIAPADVGTLTARGQYGPGAIDGVPVPGYREEPDVAPDSQTETFASMKLAIDSWRWGGVPFYIRAGKRLTKRVTELAVHFRQIPIALFDDDTTLGRAAAAARGKTRPNALVMRIQPDEGITLRFASKLPGPQMVLREVDMDFRYGTTYGGHSAPEAYERLLLDAMIGDATLFTRTDEVEYAWRFITPVLEGWATNPPAEPFPNYPAGTWGPASADALIERDGRRWRRP